MSLTNSTAVITGAAGGLGRALARELYRQDCHLALIDIDESGLKEISSWLSGRPGKVTIHIADIANEDQVALISREIRASHPHIHILINNAAVSISQPFSQLSPKDLHWLMNVNFWGTVYCTRYFLPLIQEERFGRIVNIISQFALMGFPGKTAYAASKGAVTGLTNCLKTELWGTSVKACLVIPPPMDTGIVWNGLHMDQQKREAEAAFLKKKGMAPDKVARIIVKMVTAGRFRIVIGPVMVLMDAAARLFPTLLHRAIAGRKKKTGFL